MRALAALCLTLISAALPAAQLNWLANGDFSRPGACRPWA